MEYVSTLGYVDADRVVPLAEEDGMHRSSEGLYERTAPAESGASCRATAVAANAPFVTTCTDHHEPDVGETEHQATRRS
ncbi:hypothetical protein ACFV80_25775 [Streptomyces sp. NPDC059862]|uniref:hypothetical protein n=1 Tax=Streptomyces sp. NPDC059862 TaxID=3346975 RepID=UPI00364E16EC